MKFKYESSRDSADRARVKNLMKKEKLLTYEIASLFYEIKNNKIYHKTNLSNFKKGKLAEVKANMSYTKVNLMGRSYLSHRLIWLLYYKAWPSSFLDHINGDHFDNRIENLREVTHQQNMHNARKHREGKMVGIGFCKIKNRWRAVGRVKGKSIHFGYFKDEKDAVKSYFLRMEKYGYVFLPETKDKILNIIKDK